MWSYPHISLSGSTAEGALTDLNNTTDPVLYTTDWVVAATDQVTGWYSKLASGAHNSQGAKWLSETQL